MHNRGNRCGLLCRSREKGQRCRKCWVGGRRRFSDGGGLGLGIRGSLLLVRAVILEPDLDFRCGSMFRLLGERGQHNSSFGFGTSRRLPTRGGRSPGLFPVDLRLFPIRFLLACAFPNLGFSCSNFLLQRHIDLGLVDTGGVRTGIIGRKRGGGPYWRMEGLVVVHPGARGGRTRRPRCCKYLYRQREQRFFGYRLGHCSNSSALLDLRGK